MLKNKKIIIFGLFITILLVGCESAEELTAENTNKDLASANISTPPFISREIVIKDNYFIPQSIQVYEDTKLHLRIKSMDKDYQVTIPVISSTPQTIKAGQMESYYTDTDVGDFPIFGKYIDDQDQEVNFSAFVYTNNY